MNEIDPNEARLRLGVKLRQALLMTEDLPESDPRRKAAIRAATHYAAACAMVGVAP